MGKVIFQNKKNCSSLCSRKGQGVLEYILILFITVALIGMFSKYFVKDFGIFNKEFMGSYVSCLLETGELPQLGVGGTTGASKDSQSECTSKFKQKQNGGIGGSDSNGGGNNDNKDSVGNDSSTENAANSSDSDSQGNGRGRGRRSSTYAGSASRQNPFFRPRGMRSGGGAEGGGTGSKTVEISVEGSSDNGFYNYGNRNNFDRQRKQRYIAITGQISEELKKKTEQTQKNTKSIVKVDAGTGSGTVKKISVKPPDSDAKKYVDKDEEMSFSIGNIFRIFIIAAIVIIVVVLIGGQALQMSKSWEK